MRYLIGFTIMFVFSVLSLKAAEPEGLKLNPEVWKKSKEGMVYDAPKELSEERLEQSSQNEINWNMDFLSPFFYGFIIVVVIVVLIFIIKNSKAPASVKSKRVEATSIEEAEENLPDVTLNKIYQKAIDKGDLKSALRIKFLMLLQNLIDAGMIIWKKRKTNEQYLKELDRTEHRYSFNHIVNLYDNVWYGSASITQDQYQTVVKRMDSLNKLLNGEE